MALAWAVNVFTPSTSRSCRRRCGRCLQCYGNQGVAGVVLSAGTARISHRGGAILSLYKRPSNPHARLPLLLPQG